VDAGVLTISAVQEEDRGACRDVTFDPLILPQGIASSNDPLLSARSATYAQSFRRRGREPAPIAPVTTTSVAGGAL
jgi:catalase